MRNITEYTKNCPECGSLQYYTRNWSLQNAIKNNNKCHSCSSSGKKHSEETKLKISENNARGMLGKHLSEESKQKISSAHLGCEFIEIKEWEMTNG